MNFKKIFYAAAAAANAVSITAGIILTAMGSSLAESQEYNYAAEKWDPSGGYSQISCFLSDSSGLNTDNITSLTSSLTTALQDISVSQNDKGQKLIPQAYSASAGQMTVKSDKTTGRSEAELTAVGGDFFFFRDFTLLDGSYFSDSDIMQDGAVIDRRLSWALYGSDKTAGMSIYINDTKFYIAGVIDDPQDKLEKRTAGDTPRAYISYDATSLLSLSDKNNDKMTSGDPDFSEPEAEGMKKISCFECLMPNPVKNFGYNKVKEAFESSYPKMYRIVNNSSRFEPSVRAKAFKKLSNYAVSDSSAVYPYWENASRIAEFKLSNIYFYRRLTYVIPVLTGLWLLVILYKAIGRLRKKAASKALAAVNDAVYYHGLKKKEKSEDKSNNEKEG